MRKLWLLGLIGLFMLGFTGCGGDDEPTGQVDDFDRKVMLANWADNIIIPAYTDYNTKLATLKTATTAFTSETTESNLVELRANWLAAYISWQAVGMYEIGKAEELRLINYTNIYPADVSQIEQNIQSGTANLELSSKYDEQGFPGLDYMINGLGSADADIVNVYEDEKYKTYLTTLVDRLVELSGQVLADWEGSYRDAFVANDESTATGAVNKLVNDYIFYYEKHLRAGKIGIPAGNFGSADPSTVEAFHKGDVSKELFMAGLDAIQNFFNGKHFSTSSEGESLKSYLVYLNTLKDTDKLDVLINDQFDAVRAKANELDNSFSTQVETDNTKMLETYDELQKAVILLKVDMVSAMSVQIDFVDADGD